MQTHQIHKINDSWWGLFTKGDIKVDGMVTEYVSKVIHSSVADER